jgi:multidrug efflux pump subunit AcrA (membrane-fusion protein)
MKHRSKRTTRLAAISLSGIALFLLWTGCSKSDKEETAAVSVQAATARNADISRVVNAEATIFPIAQSAITPKINAPVKKFYVVRGQKVRQGQLLATLENRDLSAAAMDNQGAYEQAQAAYNTNVGATLPEETQKAELDVQTAQQELDAQQKLYSSREDLYKQGALPRKELDQAAVTLAQARSQYNVARKHLDGLNAIGKQQALRSASGQLASAKGKLMGSEAQLSYSEIRSPINGVITDRPLYPGEMASTSTPFLTVMDIGQIIAKAHIPQTDALVLHKGDKAILELSGLDDKIPGTVTLVSPALDPNSTTVEIWVQAANPGQQMRPGMTAQVSITAQTVHDAVVVPASSLLNANGSDAQVMVINSQSQAESREVKTGIQTGDQAQIVTGLKPGEQIISQGAYGLPNKTKVRIEKPEKPEKPESASSGDKSKDAKD